MGAIAAAVSEAATSHGSFHNCSVKCDPRIRDLEHRRRIESDSEQRTALIKENWKLRREDRRLKANKRIDFLTQTGRAREHRRECTPRPAVAALDNEADRSRWPSALADYFRSAFCNSSHELQVWRNGVLKRVATRADTFSQSPELDIVFSVDEVLQAASLLKRGKCVVDGVSSEMFQALGRHCVLMLAVSFSARASGMADSEEWDHLVALLIPKAATTKGCADLRPITLLPALKKLYSLLLLSRVSPLLHDNLHEWSLGCRKGYRALGLIHAVRLPCERHREWDKKLCICKFDFRKASGSLSHVALERTLLEAGSHENLTLAILRETIRVRVAFAFQDSLGLPVPILNGVPQGDPASPLFFSATVDRLLTVCVSRWLREKVGLFLEPESPEETAIHFPILCWMGDIYLFSSDPSDLQKMLRDVVSTARPAGLLLQPTT